MATPFRSGHCSRGEHSVCLLIYGGHRCTCVCHENTAHLASTPTVTTEPEPLTDALGVVEGLVSRLVMVLDPPLPLFETIGSTEYDGDTDTLAPVVRIDGYNERAVEAALNPEQRPRMFGVATRSEADGIEVGAWCAVEAADLAGEVGRQISCLIADGHTDIRVTVEELAF